MMIRRRSVESHDIQSIIHWFEDGIEEGENGILVYPNMQTFREIYTQYVKDQLVAIVEEDKNEENDEDYRDNNNNKRRKEQSLKPRIILIATFYDTVTTVKHNLGAAGVDVRSHLDDGSLLIVDAFSGYYPDLSGMKKLVASLSGRAKKEGRVGVSAIVNMGFFSLYGGDGEASNLISYEASLTPKTDGGNVRGFSCYHVRNYENLNGSQKRELFAQGQKKLLQVTESAAAVDFEN
jgi:hypothetical protein